MYTTTDLRRFFKVSRQTISNWSREFAHYLSPTATPPENTHRRFTEDDVRVMALVAVMKNENATYENIHLALASGQRGDLPNLARDVEPIVASGQVLALQNRVSELEVELDVARQQVIRAEAERSAVVKIYQEQLSEAQAEIKALNREIGRLQARLEEDGE